MRKKTAFLLILNLMSLMVYCQNNFFDNNLKQLTDELATELSSYHTQKMAVWELTDIDGATLKIGKYIAEDISINLASKFHVVNRNQLATIIKENNLKREGFVDQTTAKQLKRLSNIDIIITGTITVLSSTIKITLEALDEDANIVAGTKGDVHMNDDIRELLGISGGDGDNSNRGYNRPLNSNEQYNNPSTVNPKCKVNNTGDYCFLNNTDRQITVVLYNDKQSCMGAYGSTAQMSLEPQQAQCAYNLNAIVLRYEIYDEKHPRCNPGQFGQINVEVCKSKTFVVK